MLPEINNKDKKSFKKGRLKCSLLAKNGAILLTWQFDNQKGRPTFTFDSPFDARIIPDINFHHVTTNESRLVINFVVDSATNIIKALLTMTMPPDLTLAFLSSVQ